MRHNVDCILSALRNEEAEKPDVCVWPAFATRVCIRLCVCVTCECAYTSVLVCECVHIPLRINAWACVRLRAQQVSMCVNGLHLMCTQGGNVHVHSHACVRVRDACVYTSVYMCVWYMYIQTRVYKTHAPVETHISGRKRTKARKTVSLTLTPPAPFSLTCPSVTGVLEGTLAPHGPAAVSRVWRVHWASPHGPGQHRPWACLLTVDTGTRHLPPRAEPSDWSEDTGITRDVTRLQIHQRRHRHRTPGWSEVAVSGPGVCGEPRSPKHPGRAEPALFSHGTLALLETLHSRIPQGFRYQQLSRMPAVGQVWKY